MIGTRVLVVGGGPVGLTLAIDLAWRGIDVTVVELPAAGEPPNVKCNQVSARSMEIYRRLGFARNARGRGYRQTTPSTSFPRPRDRNRIVPTLFSVANGSARRGEGRRASWPTPEPSHRINQTYFEPILFAHAALQPRIRIINRTAFESYTQDEGGVVAQCRNLDTGKATSIACNFMVGCDGGDQKSAK